MIAILASATTLMSISLIYSSWRRWLNPRLLVNLVGWLLLGGSAWLWAQAAGWEFGAVYFIAALPLAAWLFTALQGTWRARNSSPAHTQKLTVPAWPTLARHFGLALLVLPIAGLASALLSLVLTSLLPWQEINRLALITLLMPMLWGLFMFWCCADQKVMRPATTIIVVGLAAGFLQLG